MVHRARLFIEKKIKCEPHGVTTTAFSLRKLFQTYRFATETTVKTPNKYETHHIERNY